jgi:hypothetical protein
MGSSADNYLTTPLANSLPALVDSRTQDKSQISPRAIPVSISNPQAEGKIEVQAEMKGNFTLPKMTIGANYGEWIRPPIVTGDKGYVVLGDFYTGGQTNLGGGTASYRGEGRGNLTTAIFHPVSNTKFASNPNRNLNAALISGPQGAVVQDAAGKTILTINGTKFNYTDHDGNQVVVDMSSSKIYIKLGSGFKLYLGGDGITGTYGNVSTSAGFCTSVFARVDAP